MTPIQSVARTDQEQGWPAALRISEVPQPNRMPYAHMLRSISACLQAGWRWLERKRTQQLSSRRLRLAETISLGEKRSVSIVQVDGAQYLIGCSTGSVQLLAVLGTRIDGTSSLSATERAS